jgi:hypothetical protein
MQRDPRQDTVSYSNCLSWAPIQSRILYLDKSLIDNSPTIPELVRLIPKHPFDLAHLVTMLAVPTAFAELGTATEINDDVSLTMDAEDSNPDTTNKISTHDDVKYQKHVLHKPAQQRN